jgi:ribosome-binding protein aMBF1 (putative translation factor)
MRVRESRDGYIASNEGCGHPGDTWRKGPMSHLASYAKKDIMVGMSKKKTDLAKEFRAAFKASGMSRFELSKKSRVSYSAIHRFIGGERDLTLGTASKLANVLGLELRAKKGR